MVIKKWKKERMCVIVSPHCRELKERKTKKSVHPLVHPWPKILRRKEEER